MILSSILPDTLKIVDITPHQARTLRPEYIGLIGVMIGALISILGNLLINRQQSKNQKRNAFFQKRLEIYSSIVEISWQLYSVRTRIDKTEKGEYPFSYESYENLRNWMNSFVEIMDKNILFLDQKTYDYFIKINHKVLDNLRELNQDLNKDTIDKRTRDIGRRDLKGLQDLSKSFIDSIKSYLKRKYKIELEDVE